MIIITADNTITTTCKLHLHEDEVSENDDIDDLLELLGIFYNIFIIKLLLI